MQPKLGINYQWNPGLLTYASYAVGATAGGYNSAAATQPIAETPVDPDKIKAYEVGVKTTSWGGRLRTSTSLFYNDYEDYQASVQNPIIGGQLVPGAVFANAGKGLGNGVPVSAAVGRRDVCDQMAYGATSDTWSANPLSSAAVLATLDEASFANHRMKILWMDTDLAMGKDHPMVWSHCVGKGRAFYSALGHTGKAYAEPAHLQMIAGAIAERCGVPPSTMSHHLSTLERAGLVQSARESRLIRYRADYPGMRRLLTFLMQDCCGGAPEMCSGLMAGLALGAGCKVEGTAA